MLIGQNFVNRLRLYGAQLGFSYHLDAGEARSVRSKGPDGEGLLFARLSDLVIPKRGQPPAVPVLEYQ